MNNSELNLLHLVSQKIKERDPASKKFYENSSITYSVFRSLSATAKQFVIMLLFTSETSLPKKAFDHLLKTKNYLGNDNELLALRVFVEDEKDTTRVKLESNFTKKLIDIFSRRYEPPFKECTIETKETLKSIISISLSKWRKVHQMIVKTQIVTENNYINKVIIDVLSTGDLIKKKTSSDSSITTEGFQFILNSTDYQINAFIYYYAKYQIQNRKKDPQKIIGILSALNLCISETKSANTGDMELEDGNTQSQKSFSYYAYRYEDDPDHKEIINDFYHLGLTWKSDYKANEFFLTPLLSNFLFERPLAFNTESNLNLIVETNFKVYAYSNSPLHQSLLELFTSIDCRLPNLIVATLNQTSVKKAYKDGINREQIVKFLSKNIHSAQRALVEKEKTRTSNAGPGGDILEKIKVDSMYTTEGENMIPENVRQQLEMWEREKDKIYEEGGEDSD